MKRSDTTRNKRGIKQDDQTNPFEEQEPRKEQVDNSPIVGQTENQKRYLKAMSGQNLVFATGPAGVGKTFLCTAIAAKMLVEKKIERIIITRPAVEAGESLGFLPGELDEKFDPYLEPFKDVLYRRLGRSFTEYLINSKKIVAVPLAYIRGRTFRNAMVILDEAQNTTPKQMKNFLTRFGENCTVVVNGDPTQMDIHGPCGFTDAIERLFHIPEVRLVEFTKADIVRSGLVQKIVEAYES